MKTAEERLAELESALKLQHAMIEAQSAQISMLAAGITGATETASKPVLQMVASIVAALGDLLAEVVKQNRGIINIGELIDFLEQRSNQVGQNGQPDQIYLSLIAILRTYHQRPVPPHTRQ